MLGFSQETCGEKRAKGGGRSLSGNTRSSALSHNARFAPAHTQATREIPDTPAPPTVILLALRKRSGRIVVPQKLLVLCSLPHAKASSNPFPLLPLCIPTMLRCLSSPSSAVWLGSGTTIAQHHAYLHASRPGEWLRGLSRAFRSLFAQPPSCYSVCILALDDTAADRSRRSLSFAVVHGAERLPQQVSHHTRIVCSTIHHVLGASWPPVESVGRVHLFLASRLGLMFEVFRSVVYVKQAFENVGQLSVFRESPPSREALLEVISQQYLALLRSAAALLAQQ